MVTGSHVSPSILLTSRLARNRKYMQMGGFHHPGKRLTSKGKPTRLTHQIVVLGTGKSTLIITVLGAISDQEKDQEKCDIP
jgi:hypothetical protein